MPDSSKIKEGQINIFYKFKHAIYIFTKKRSSKNSKDMDHAIIHFKEKADRKYPLDPPQWIVRLQNLPTIGPMVRNLTFKNI